MNSNGSGSLSTKQKSKIKHFPILYLWTLSSHYGCMYLDVCLVDRISLVSMLHIFELSHRLKQHLGKTSCFQLGIERRRETLRILTETNSNQTPFTSMRMWIQFGCSYVDSDNSVEVDRLITFESAIMLLRLNQRRTHFFFSFQSLHLCSSLVEHGRE